MSLLSSLFRKKPTESPEEELRLIEFKLKQYDVPDREKLERRKATLAAEIAKASSAK
jgi:hypothetical protein